MVGCIVTGATWRENILFCHLYISEFDFNKKEPVMLPGNAITHIDKFLVPRGTLAITNFTTVPTFISVKTDIFSVCVCVCVCVCVGFFYHILINIFAVDHSAHDRCFN